MKITIEADNGDTVKVEHTDGGVLVNVNTQHGSSSHAWLPVDAAETLAVAILAACRAEADQ